jgi:outer membrane protein
MPRSLIIITTIAILLAPASAWSEEGIGDDAPETVTLAEALDLALSNNLELKAAAEALAAARLGVRAARALDWFSLAAQGSSTKTGPAITHDIPGQGQITISPSKFQHSISLSLTQPIFTFGLNRNLKEVAGLGLGTSLANYETKLDEIQYLVERSYYDLIHLEMLLDVQVQNLKRAENDMRIAELRYNAGQVARFEVIRADVAVKNAEEVLIGTNKALEIAKLAWRKVLGIDEYMAPEIIDPDDLVPVELSFTLDESKETALAMRPELKGLRHGVDAAEIAAKLKSLRPDLRFIGSYSFSSLETTFSAKESWRLMFNLNIPLWDGGRANAEMAQGMHEAEALRIQLSDLEEAIKIDVAEAYLAVEEALERMDATSATLELALEAKRMAEIGYREGVVTLQEVLSAEVDLAGAQANRIGAVYDYLKAIARLRKAMGVDMLPGEEIAH